MSEPAFDVFERTRDLRRERWALRSAERQDGTAQKLRAYPRLRSFMLRGGP